jgi:hypothetical protein
LHLLCFPEAATKIFNKEIMNNKGYSAEEIAILRQDCLAAGTTFRENDEEPQSPELRHFHFVGTHEGQEVIFDTVIYTLEMLYVSNLYQIAEERALEEYPDHEPWGLTMDEEGNMVPDRELTEEDEEVEEFKASIILELEEDDEYKVQETVAIDDTFDYGVGLEVALNVPEITNEVIAKFIEDFNGGNLQLDQTLYSFEIPDSEDED